MSRVISQIRAEIKQIALRWAVVPSSRSDCLRAYEHSETRKKCSHLNLKCSVYAESFIGSAIFPSGTTILT